MASIPWFPPKEPLSPHFSWTEVIRNSGYTRVPLGPLLLPNGKLVTPRNNARTQALAMEQVRARVNIMRAKHGLPATGINTLSWARSWTHNKSVGGATNSQHLYFRACDLRVQEIDRLCPWTNGRHDFDLILESVFANGGVGLYTAGNRHMDTRGSRARWTVA